ncbi:MAG TPA: hypothetical protein PKX15_08925 [Bacteroidales bacterium]|nr:hypothetical protein [Bacteroidales bacterium]
MSKLNVNLLAARLKRFEENTNASKFAKHLWKPSEGKQDIRIVPYKFNPENPFIELKFYYKLGDNNYLAPCTFGKPDPVLETIEALRAGGSNEEKKLAAKLAPVTRTYVPIIVRGEEELGVRFWGFGAKVYRQLLMLMVNPKYGDITSYTEGRDIEVTFTAATKKKNAAGQSFPETDILADPNVSPVVDPSRRDLMEKVKDQVDILTIFPLKSYDELKEAVERWINPKLEPLDESVTPETEPFDEEEVVKETASKEQPSTSKSKDELADEFERFFNTNEDN